MRPGLIIHVHTNVTAMVGVVAAALVLAAVLTWLQRATAPDRPPAGLSRLVPVGSQVDAECRRGIAALERWLLAHGPAGPEGA